MYKKLIEKYPEYTDTCSIKDCYDGSFTFIRNKKYLPKDIKEDIVLISPKNIEINISNVIVEYVDYPDYVFTMIHNILNKNKKHDGDYISSDCKIHESALIGVEGIHIAKSPEGMPVQMKHMGCVIINYNVEILALSTIQRAVFGETIIGANVKIDSHVNIGHNSYIGRNTVITLGSVIGGSCHIGENCMIGLGSIIKNGTHICDNVIIGQGSNVVSDIEKPGLYIGNPARFHKEYDKNWNF
jgi:UDP-3-O-[3-hydroxymyristoyl] glucosamine N-acyltransferase